MVAGIGNLKSAQVHWGTMRVEAPRVMRRKERALFAPKVVEERDGGCSFENSRGMRGSDWLRVAEDGAIV
jgi:hypothetical protein